MNRFFRKLSVAVRPLGVLSAVVLLNGMVAFAETPPSMRMNHAPPYPQHPSDCSEMQLWDVGMAMCMPFPMAGMPMRMLMVSGSVFAGGITQEKPRGNDAFYSTNMVMFDLGTTLGARHYLNLDFMGTAEKWTLPDRGYPLLLQIGEETANGQPFLDAQHPHNSPIMGLTLSDTIRLGDDQSFALKLSFAPRGETTEGPVAFMHRVTGMINSDAPLGHHIGQDVGHVTSTVFAASLKWDSSRLEVSAFHGAEPSPTKVDLPFGAPDSAALRLVHQYAPDGMVMASVSYVNQPEPEDPDVTSEVRTSASAYQRFLLSPNWTLDNTLIYGGVTHYDHADILVSFGEEFVFSAGAPNVWGRIEVLQRTGAELHIPALLTSASGQWVAAATLGYTHYIASIDGARLGLGAAVTKDFLPDAFASAYGGNPWSAKIFFHLKGMRMWDL